MNIHSFDPKPAFDLHPHHCTLGTYPTQTTFVYMDMGSTHFASLWNIIWLIKLRS